MNVIVLLSRQREIRQVKGKAWDEKKDPGRYVNDGTTQYD